MSIVNSSPSGTISEIFFSLIYSVFKSLYNSDYLTEILTIESVILAFVIPLRYNILSRLSEKYDSLPVNKMFLSELKTRFLLYIIVFSLVLIVSYKAFPIIQEISFIPMFVYSLFIAVMIILTLSLNSLRNYLLSYEYLVKNLSKWGFDIIDKS